MNHDGHRLLQAGVVLFLFALIVGIAVPRFALPRLALSAHLLGITQGTFLIAIGVLWPRLRLTRGQSLAGQVLALYGCVAAWIANVAGAAWGAGGSIVPMASGGTKGTALQEMTMNILLRSAAVCLIALMLFLLWALRSRNSAVADPSEGS
ncbi:MAG TPA: hydrogenase [Thermoanaerobaculia bacterium]|nr:hydrogenase [Thermoanaerobaculia bacterium]